MLRSLVVERFRLRVTLLALLGYLVVNNMAESANTRVEQRRTVIVCFVTKHVFGNKPVPGFNLIVSNVKMPYFCSQEGGGGGGDEGEGSGIDYGGACSQCSVAVKLQSERKLVLRFSTEVYGKTMSKTLFSLPFC